MKFAYLALLGLVSASIDEPSLATLVAEKNLIQQDIEKAKQTRMQIEKKLKEKNFVAQKIELSSPVVTN